MCNDTWGKNLDLRPHRQRRWMRLILGSWGRTFIFQGRIFVYRGRILISRGWIFIYWPRPQFYLRGMIFIHRRGNVLSRGRILIPRPDIYIQRLDFHTKVGYLYPEAGFSYQSRIFISISWIFIPKPDIYIQKLDFHTKAEYLYSEAGIFSQDRIFRKRGRIFCDFYPVRLGRLSTTCMVSNST